MGESETYPTRDQLITRLRRAEGQLRGVQRMLDEGDDCKKVLSQLAAVKSAVDQVGLLLISENLRSCVSEGGADCLGSFDAALSNFLRHTTLSH